MLLVRVKMPPITPAPADIPDDESETMSSAIGENTGIQLSDSDSISDSETLDHNGYELLSQDPENVYINENEEEDCNSASDMEDSISSEVDYINSYTTNNPVVVSSCRITCPEIPKMDEEHIETIKSVMKGITLPSSSLPQWATLVPEEEWKAALLSEMQAKDSKSSCIRGTHSKPSLNRSQMDMSSEMFR